MSHVCMANASFTAVSQDTSLRPTAIAASASTLNFLMRRMYPQVPVYSNMFPSGGTERSSKVSAFPARSVKCLYNYLRIYHSGRLAADYSFGQLSFLFILSSFFVVTTSDPPSHFRHLIGHHPDFLTMTDKSIFSLSLVRTHSLSLY